MSISPPEFHRNVFRYRPFAILWTGRMLSTLAIMIQSVTLGWQVYMTARLDHGVEESSFLVGMIGLAQFLPMFALALPAGEAADRYDRRKIMIFCGILHTFIGVAMTLLALDEKPHLTALFLVAGLFGVVRAYMMPATGALMPMLVPRAAMPQAIGWSSLSRQVGMIFGPWIGGALCAASASLSYGAACLLSLIATFAYVAIKGETRPQHKPSARLAMIREGLQYVWNTKIIFGAISLDLFAVLLGGATALLPVFARDILHVGADGFGILRAGIAIGGAAAATWLGLWPISRHAGIWMLSSVAVFGASTIAFAYSESLWLSVALMALAGAADGVSVYVRQSILQIVTPDAMRGRVSSVSGLFVSASNELGEFESGVAARLLGPIGATVFGGVGSLLITLIWARLFPALRKVDNVVPAEMPPA